MQVGRDALALNFPRLQRLHLLQALVGVAATALKNEPKYNRAKQLRRGWPPQSKYTPALLNSQVFCRGYHRLIFLEFIFGLQLGDSRGRIRFIDSIFFGYDSSQAQPHNFSYRP